MGRRLAALFGRLRKLLLQHHPDARRRHARSGPPRRLDQGHPRLRRAGRQQEGEGHHRRRRLQRRRADAVGVHPQPAFPEPDQGPPHQPRSRALRRGCGPRPFRPLSRRQYGPRPRSARLDPRADGGTPPPPRRARGQAQDRHLAPASSACPASSPTAVTTIPKAPSCSSSRATAPAARPSRLATARPRRSSRSAARSSTSPAPPPTRSAPTARSPTSTSPSAAATATNWTRMRSATRRSSS